METSRRKTVQGFWTGIGMCVLLGAPTNYAGAVEAVDDSHFDCPTTAWTYASGTACATGQNSNNSTGGSGRIYTSPNENRSFSQVVGGVSGGDSIELGHSLMTSKDNAGLDPNCHGVLHFLDSNGNGVAGGWIEDPDPAPADGVWRWRSFVAEAPTGVGVAQVRVLLRCVQQNWGGTGWFDKVGVFNVGSSGGNNYSPNWQPNQHWIWSGVNDEDPDWISQTGGTAGIPDTTLEDFYAIVQEFRWARFEGDDGDGTSTGSGTFNWTDMDQYVANAEAREINIVIRVPWRSFTGNQKEPTPWGDRVNLAPWDLCGWQDGGTPSNGYQTQALYPSGSVKGYTLPMWHWLVRQRYQKALMAIIDRYGPGGAMYSPYFIGVAGSETAGMTDSPMGGTYTLGKMKTQYRNLALALTGHHPDILWMPGVNSLPGVSGQRHMAFSDAYHEIFDGVPRRNLVVWAPDILIDPTPNEIGNEDGTSAKNYWTGLYQLLSDKFIDDWLGSNAATHKADTANSPFKGSNATNFLLAAQTDSHRRWKNKDVNMEQLFAFARDTLFIDGVMWQRTANGSNTYQFINHDVVVAARPWNYYYPVFPVP